jgi:ribonuclease J
LTLTLTVHRGTRAIGGSCIEIAAPDGERLILDAGRPLDAPRGARGLLPASLDLDRPATVLFSHAHMDHWGLIAELPAAWPIWAGEKAAELMRLSAEIFREDIARPIATWNSRATPFVIGGFTVTPYLTDHSAPDAYMLLIEGHRRRILYSGDFRAHGRKAPLVEAMIAAPPARIDVLVMEGTNLGADKPMVSEAELEDAFVALAHETPRHVFVQWSAQNVDRTVTLFKAARRTGRKLVVDLYGADVLRRIGGGTRLPVPGPDFPELKVLITPGGRKFYAARNREDFVTAMAKNRFATSRRRLADDRAIIMLRDSMVRDFARGGLGFTPRDAYAFSSWSGYLDPADASSGWARAAAAGARTVKLHTSGHASPADLARFAAAIAPKALVPVHGIAWDQPTIPLPPIRRLSDGERWEIP